MPPTRRAPVTPTAARQLGRLGAGLLVSVGCGLLPLYAAQAPAELEAMALSVRAKGLDATADDFSRLGEAYLAAGRVTEAAAAFDRAMGKGAADRDFLARLGLLWEASGRIDRAVPTYAAAVQAAPDHPDAAGLLLRSAIATEVVSKDNRRALEIYRRAAEIYPGTPEAGDAIARGSRLAANLREQDQVDAFGRLALMQFPTDRALMWGPGRRAARHLSEHHSAAYAESCAALVAERPGIIGDGTLARSWAEALHRTKRSDEGLAVLVRSAERDDDDDMLFSAADFAQGKVKDAERAKALYLRLLAEHPLCNRASEAADRAEELGADLSDQAERVALAKLRRSRRGELLKSTQDLREDFARNGHKRGEALDRMGTWFEQAEPPIEAWPWELQDARCRWAALVDDRAAYRAALVALGGVRDQRSRAIDGLAGDHRVPDAWIDEMGDALLPLLAGGSGAFVARYHVELAERALHKRDEARLLAHAKQVLDGNLQRYRGEVLDLLLEQALRSKDDERIATSAAALLAHVEAHGGYDHHAGERLRRALHDEIGAWPAERRVAFLELLRDGSGTQSPAEWAGALLVAERLAVGDAIAAAIELHRGIDACRWDRSEHYDAMMEQAAKLLEAGHPGLAAGAYDHIARRFARVGEERIQRARQLAGQALARLGGAVVESLLEVDDDDPLAPILRAQAKLSLGDEAEAYRLAAPVLDLMQEKAARVPLDLALLVARNLAREARNDDAATLLQAWSRANGAGPQGGVVQLAIGDVRFAAENFPAALLEFRSVIASFPGTAEATDAQLRIGDCHLAMRQYDEAQGVYQQVLDHEDEVVRAKATFRLAVLESERGDDEAALTLFREVAQMNPPKDLANQLYLDWGKALIDRNRLSEAEDVIMMVGLQAGREPIAPGEPLRITLNDPFLHTGQNRRTVPVLVRAASGDREVVELTLSQDVKGMYTSRLPTVLGEAAPGDRILQITGDDSISYDYTDDFKKNRKTMTIGSGEIPIAADAQIKVSASLEGARFDLEGDADGDELANLGLDFDTEAIARAREIAASASRTFRGANHVKPGNPIYLSVLDPDRDLGSGPDALSVVVASSSGDRVQVELRETGPHSGVFRGELPTATMPPDVVVTDSAPGSSKLGLLLGPDDAGFDRADSAWVAAGDFKDGKAVTLDFKQVRPVDRFLWSRGLAPDAPDEVEDTGPEPGLNARFWAGRSMDGPVIFEEQGLPRHDNREIPGHGSSNWSARWMGELQVPADGTYTFEARSDDGCEIIVGGKRLFDGEHWKDQAPATRSSSIALSKGWVPIEIEYYQGGGGSTLSVGFGPKGQVALLTREQLRAKPSIGSGFALDRVPTRYRIETSANGRDWTTLARDGVGVMPRGWLARQLIEGRRPPSRTRDIQRSLLGAAIRRPGDRKDYLDGGSLPTLEAGDEPVLERVVGRILIPEAGVWEFALVSGGQSWLAVGGSMVVEKARDEVDEPADGTPRWRGAVELPYGLASLSLLRSSARGHSGLQLLWRRPGAEAFEPVPAAAVDHDADDAAVTELLGRSLPMVERLEGRYGEEIRFDPVHARFLRLEIDSWNRGDAPAVARIAAWSGEDRLLPAAGVDYRALATNDELELSAGDGVEVSYLDRKTKDGVSADRIDRMTATYFDGRVAFQEAETLVDGSGRIHEFLFDRFRFQTGERLTVRVVDYDLDVSNQPDEVDVTLVSSAGELTITATETGLATGEFQAEIRTAAPGAASKPKTLVVEDGELVIASYHDGENLSPGVGTKRSASIREAVTSAGGVAIHPSRLEPVAGGDPGEFEPRYDDPVAGQARVALAPLLITVTDPDSVISQHSEARVRLTTSGGTSLDVGLLPADDQGFRGSVALVLGAEGADTWRLHPPGQRASSAVVKLADAPGNAEPVLPVRGGERITVTYLEGLAADASAAEADRAASAAGLPAADAVLLTDGRLGSFTDDYRSPMNEAYVGGTVYLKVEDPDADGSDERDRVTVAITSGLGDELTLELEETESHSGTFTASVAVTHAAVAIPSDQILQTTFGDELAIAYREADRASGEPPAIAIPVSRGFDGSLDGFAKRFGDDAMAAATHIKMAECYFELYKTHRAQRRELEQGQGRETDIAALDELIAAEIDAGTELLRRTIHAYPDLGEIDEVLYLLANFEQEGGSPLDAIDRYRELLAGYPSSPRAPEAQYKMAQCYEALDRFDDAWDSYVRLAYRWPDHDLVADSMARIGDYYEQRGKAVLAAAEAKWTPTGKDDRFRPPPEAREDIEQAGRIYGQLVERFGDREIAPAIMLKQGNCRWLLQDHRAAEQLFATFVERYPDSAYLPTALYWAGRAALESNDPKGAYLRFGHLIRDYPETSDAKRARGLLVQDPRFVDISFTDP